MAQLTDQQRKSIEAAIFAGNKIEAIKLYREATGIGLAEAKQAVETMEASLRQQHPEKFSASRKGGCLGSVAALCLAIGGVLLAAIVLQLI
jgi:hypothetical protein